MCCYEIAQTFHFISVTQTNPTAEKVFLIFSKIPNSKNCFGFMKVSRFELRSIGFIKIISYIITSRLSNQHDTTQHKTTQHRVR